MNDVHGQTMWQVTADTVIEWHYDSGDEFNDTTVNADIWTSGFPWGKAMLSQSNYVLEENIVLENGNMKMVVNKLDSLIPLGIYEIDANYLRESNIRLQPGNAYVFDYSTALLWSKRQYRYGLFEICFKGVTGQGIWPAFWLYGGNPNYEIDFFELKGEQEKKLHVDLHCPHGCGNFKEGIFGYRRGWGHWIKLNGKLSESFNVVTGIWQPGSVSWFLNGELVAYSSLDISVPMNLVVGTGVARDSGPFKPGANSQTPFPNYFEVDYIRVYKPTREAVTINSHSVSITGDSLHQAHRSEPVEKRSEKIKHLRNAAIDKKPVFVTLLPMQHGDFCVKVLGASPKQPVSLSIAGPNNERINTYTLTMKDETRSFKSEDVTELKVESKGKVITHRIKKNY